MSAIQTLQKPVQWFEGMMLSPQHFQQNNLYLEQLIHHQLQRVTPYFYGVLDIAFDLSELGNNKILVKHIHAVMGDGTVVNYNKNDNELTSIENSQSNLLKYSLDDLAKKDSTQPFYIYLAIAKLDGCDGKDAQDKLRRYDSVNTGRVSDFYESKNTVDVVRLQAKLQLLVKTQLSENYSYIPILKLQKNNNGEFDVSDYTAARLSFAPLINRTPNQTDIWKEVEGRINQLRRRASERLSHLNDQQKSGSSLGYFQKLDIHHITQYLPMLKVMLNSEKCHPFDVYLALINLVSGMALLQPDVLPRNYNDYKQEKLLESFKPLLNDIDSILKKLELNFEVSTLEQSKAGDYTFELNESLVKDDLMLAFKLSVGVSREQLEQWIQSAHICDESQLKELWKERSKGAQRQHVNVFNRICLSESDDELFYILPKDSKYFPKIEQKQGTTTLIITSSDEHLDKFMPSLISSYSVKSKQGESSING